MRFAIVSDIHGNEVALHSVVDDIDSTGIDQVYAAGDLALLGPRPRECVAILQERGWSSVRGNTDRMIAEFDASAPSGEAEASVAIAGMISWTRDRLGDEMVEYLGSLPPSISIRSENGAGNLVIVHGTPRSDEEGLNADENDERLLILTQQASAYAVVGGHTHRSFGRMVRGTLIANAGSVGRSYEGRPSRATYLVLEDERGVWTVEIRHVRYDRQRNFRSLEAEGAPITHELSEPFMTAVAPD